MPSVTSASSAPERARREPGRGRPQHVAEHALVADRQWSAGSTTITSSSGRSTATVASAIAAAVLRPAGSISDPDVGELGPHELLVSLVGHDRDVDRDAVAIEPASRRTVAWRRRLVAEQRQERLGALGARQRPQAGAAPARHDRRRTSGHSRERWDGAARHRVSSLAAGRRARSKARPRRRRTPSIAGRCMSANRTNLATRAALRRELRTVDRAVALTWSSPLRTIREPRGRGGRSARVEERV